jgi:type I restriction enzyme S subunit
MTEKNSNLPEGFKMTELGLLPKDWEGVRLESIAIDEKGSIKMGPFGSQLKKEKLSNHGIKVYGQENLIKRDFSLGNRFVDGAKFDSLRTFEVKPLDVLVTMMGTIGHSAVFPANVNRGIIDSHLIRIRVNRDEVEPIFLKMVFETDTIKKEIESQGHGVIMKGLNTTIIKNLLIPLPPLPEQKAIARVLSTIQKSIEAQDKIITAARELKKSLMHHLFTYGPVPVSKAEHVLLKETEIGPVPEHWEVAKLGELGEIITGTTPSTKVDEYYGEPYMFITPGDIHKTKYITKTQKYLSKKGLSVSRPLPRNTVLVVCIGATIGKTAMTSVDNSVTNQQINSIITNQRIEPHYCFYAVTHYSPLLPALAGRVAIPILNKNNFSKFLIPLPSLSEQQEIATTLSTLDNKIESEENRKAALQALFKAMLHQLMTGKVRVKDLEATAA